MKRPPGIRRIVVRACAWLLLGALVNIAVAWIFECRPYPGNATMNSISDEEAKAAMPVGEDRSIAPLIVVNGSRQVVAGRTEYMLLAFHRELTSEGTIRYANQLVVWQAGWPCRSVQGWSGIGRTPSEIGTHGLWRVKRIPASVTSRVREHGLPFLPVWPGFAVNSMFYGAIVWLLFAAPWQMRRWWRSHRGRCCVCGYDLRDQPDSDPKTCPECGASA